MSAVLEKFKTSISKESKSFLDNDILAEAEKLGRELCGVTTSKMRQYFDDIKGLRRMLESGATEQQAKVKLRLVLSRLAYDVQRAGRSQRPHMEKLESFLKACITRVLDGRDVAQAVKDFAVFFECVYGYFYAGSRPSNEEEQ
ncbi:MAG: type III-A CRISPR-associated protein Csm2 [candidate division WOR-3 bacterium]